MEISLALLRLVKIVQSKSLDNTWILRLFSWTLHYVGRVRFPSGTVGAHPTLEVKKLNPYQV